MQRILQYCSDFVKNYVEALPKYKERNWDNFKKRLLQDYIAQDIKQKQYLKTFFEDYKAKAAAEKEDLKQYCLHFYFIAAHLLKKRELDEYTACLWFLQGLKKSRRLKIIRKASINTLEPSTYFFTSAYKAALKISKKEEGLVLLESNTKGAENIQKRNRGREQK